MKRLILPVLILSVFGLRGQSLYDAKLALDNTNIFETWDILFKLLNDKHSDKNEIAYYLGNAYTKTNMNDSAMLFYQMATHAPGKDPIKYLATGRIALLQGDLAKAGLDFDKAMELTHYKQASIYFETGTAWFWPETIDLNKALKDLERAYALDSNGASILLRLGEAYIRKAEADSSTIMYAKGLEFFRKARKIEPLLTVTWIREGRELVNELEYGIDALQKTGALIRILDNLNDNKKSREELAVMISEPDSSIKNLLLDSATECLQKGVFYYPNFYQVRLLLGNALYKRHHDAAEVIPIYKKADELRVGGYYDACFNLGIVYNEINDAENAKSYLLKAVDLRPNKTDVKFMLAQCYAKLNQP
jgi:tetratricopeptide (TPR) repeat protein